MKWEWKNCPMSWRGSFTNGKDQVPTIGLEAVVDSRYYFWHAFFGVPGSQNDINVIDQSDLFEELTRGNAPEVHFVLNNKVYDMGYYLTDGIYPEWYVLMQSFKNPVDNKQQLLTELQEAKRKQVECAFGVLQARWRILALACKLWRKEAMDLVITCCIILHNMIVEDEWEENEDAVKNNNYVFQEANGERFQVDKLYKDESTESFGSANIREMRRRYQDNARHHELKNDLIEHLWKRQGSK